VAPENEYNPQEQITVTMSRKEWEGVVRWLQYGEDYHACKVHEYIDNPLYMSPISATMAMDHRRQSECAESLRKIVEAVLYPQPVPETEE